MTPRDAHPPGDRLIAEALDPVDELHLARCPACRSERRSLLAYHQEPELPEEFWRDVKIDVAQRLVRDLEGVAALGDASHESSDRFRLDERTALGASDRGVLFDVFDVQRQKRVALRWLPDFDATQVAEVVARLAPVRHPAVARYLDVVPGSPCGVSRELVPGEALDVVFPTGTRSRLIRWVGVLTSALSALHGAGLVHGRLGPSNVRIEPGGTLVVVDAALGALPARSPWRAPELADGEATAAGDWYALGKMLERYAEQLLGGLSTSPNALPAVCARLREADPARRATGAELANALLLEQGLSGLDGTRYGDRVQIDNGGMGDLFVVRDPVLRRRVALKRMREAQAAKSDSPQRFQREATIAAQLQHPNIVPVHELDWAPDGSPFFTMRYIEGKRDFGTLIQELHDPERAKGLTLRTVIESLLRLCDAVAYAHHRGVLHLDLKPKNVLVGAFGELQLLDWGGAWVFDAGEHTIDVALSTGDYRGAVTEGWRAPEQRWEDPRYAHRVKEVGPASDVYALGALLYFVLTHLEPAKGAREGQFEPVASVAPRAPRELAAVAHKALRDKTADRYRDVASLRDDLSAWLAGEAVHAHTYSWVEDVERRTRGRRGIWLLGVVSVLVVGTVGWFAFLSWRESARAVAREVEREAVVLAEQARIAVISGDRIASERLAARSIAVADAPEARGLLARLSRRPYPRLAGACTLEGSLLSCAPAGGVVTWTVPDTVAGGACDRYTWTPNAIGGFVLTDATGALVLERHEPTTAPGCGPYGGRLAFGVEDAVRVWRLAPPSEEQMLGGHVGRVTAVAWSPDGQRLASADSAGTVRMWDAGSGAELARLPGHGAVRGLSFVADQPLLLVAAERSRAWDFGSVGAPHQIEAHVPLMGVDWGPGVVATLDRQGTWRAWDAASARFSGDEVRSLGAADLSPDGRSVLSLERDGSVSVWELGPSRRRWGPVDAKATAIAWVSDAWVASGGEDGVLRAYDAVTGSPLADGPGGAPIVALSAADDRVLVLRSDGAADWVSQGVILERWSGVVVGVVGARGRTAVARADGSVMLDGTPPLLGAPVLALAFSDDGAWLAIARSDQTVRIYQRGAASWTERAASVADLRNTASLAFSPEGDALVVQTPSSVAEIWDLAVLTADASDLERAVVSRYGASELGGSR